MFLKLHIFQINFDTVVPAFPGVLSAVLDILSSCSVPEHTDECWFGEICVRCGVKKWL